MKRVAPSSFVAFCVIFAACGGSSSPPINNDGGSAGGSSSSSSSSSGIGTGTGTSSGAGSTSTSTSSSGGVDGGVNDFNRCREASDCEWGEINKEILAKTDCMCLFGCPHLPLNKTTVRRREDQFKALCDGRTDGNGKPCPIDDCARPGPIECRNGVCAAPSRDGGNGNQM